MTHYHQVAREKQGTEKARRNFLRIGSVAAFTSLFLPSDTIGQIFQLQDSCAPTTPDIEGPYYKAGSPHKVRIADPSELGTRLFITGTAHTTDCTTPVGNVLLDIWQANKDGIYDTSDSYRLRGKVTTNSDGQYSFETILPGNYQNRPRHIHLTLTAPNQAPVITQLYFEGDPDITNDPWASQPSAQKRIIPLLQDDKQQLYGIFDIVVGTTTNYDEGKIVLPKPGYLFNNHPNPIGSSTVFQGEIFGSGIVELNIVDINGTMVCPLVKQRMASGMFTVQWDGRTQTASRAAPGIYICQLIVNSVPIDYLKVVLQ